MRLKQPRLATVWTLSILALTATDEGEPELAERYAREAMAVVEEIGAQTATEFTAVPTVLADALRLGGKLEQAREHLTPALAAEAQRPGSIGHAMALTFDAQLALAERDRDRARARAAAARKIIDSYPDVGVLADRLATVEAALKQPTAGARAGSQPSKAERRVLALLPTALTHDQIAAQLHLSTDTVRSHIRRLYQRTGATTRDEAVAIARGRVPALIRSTAPLPGSGERAGQLRPR